MKGVLVVGSGESGKDTFAEALSLFSAPYLRYSRLTGSTSRAIAAYLAEKRGTDPEEEFKTRRENRDLWFDIGNHLRTYHGPDALVRWCEKQGNNIVTGVRTPEEVLACKDRFLVVEIVRPGVTSFSGSFYGYPGVVDVVVQNNHGIRELEYLSGAFREVFMYSITLGLPFPVSEFAVTSEVPE